MRAEVAEGLKVTALAQIHHQPQVVDGLKRIRQVDEQRMMQLAEHQPLVARNLLPGPLAKSLDELCLAHCLHRVPPR